jgi:hypothetical protein
VLDGVTFQGTLDLSTASSLLVIKNGITLTGLDGTGNGLVNLTGSHSGLYADGTQTLDNATIDIGNSSQAAGIYNVSGIFDNADLYVDHDGWFGSGIPAVLTLGANLTIDQTGTKAEIAGVPAGPGVSLTNPGAGIINAGTINANFTGGSFTINPTSFTNQGTIHSSNGDKVTISSPNVTNSGNLWADGGNLVVSSPLSGTGTDEITGAGIIEFAGAVSSGQMVTFDASSTGTLKLDNSPGFAGTVSGLALGNYIDLTDMQFASLQAPTYTPNANNTGGTLTVTDGQHTANIALLGQYMAGSFATSADGHGGTLITDPPPSTQPPALTPPHP